MKIPKGDLLERLCRLTSSIMQRKHDYHLPADCFCKGGKHDFQFDDEILKYVEDAVNQRMEKEDRDGTDTDAETGAPVTEQTGP